LINFALLENQLKLRDFILFDDSKISVGKRAAIRDPIAVSIN